MSDPPFDASQVNWVTVEAERFLLEPFGTDYKPHGPGRLVVVSGEDNSRSRGVEVDVHADSQASVWVPNLARVFWLPDLREDDGRSDQPWKHRAVEIDVSSGEPVEG